VGTREPIATKVNKRLTAFNVSRLTALDSVLYANGILCGIINLDGVLTVSG
jgi:hypothetical protein